MSCFKSNIKTNLGILFKFKMPTKFIDHELVLGYSFRIRLSYSFESCIKWRHSCIWILRFQFKMVIKTLNKYKYEVRKRVLICKARDLNITTLLIILKSTNSINFWSTISHCYVLVKGILDIC